MTDGAPLRLGTRQSALAKWQAHWVASQLQGLGADVEIIYITTRGDVQTGPINATGGVGAFTKAIQQALLQDEIDLAVHSLKDLPTEPIDGLALAAVPLRESHQDALVSRDAIALDDLAPGATIATGSPRRRAQLLHARPDLKVEPIRGNVDTRLRKLDDGTFDAVILAEAGLKRLGLENRITQVLSPDVMLPAIGQGALGIETRQDDRPTINTVGQLNHGPSHHAVLAERALLAHLRGGCLAPVGAWARVDQDETLHLSAGVLSMDGQQRLTATGTGPTADAEAVGKRAADQLIAQGAGELIAAVRDL